MATTMKDLQKLGKLREKTINSDEAAEKFMLGLVEHSHNLMVAYLALANIVSAWNSLSDGYHSSDEVKDWLTQTMKPAIDLAQDALDGDPEKPDENG